MKKLKLFTSLFFVGVASLALHSCVKQSYSNPPDLSGYDPKLSVNATIASVVQPYWGVNTGKNRVLGDTTIYGVVIADDRSGNFYKQIIIEDSTGGVNVVINNTYIYSTFPVGRKVYVKLKGLVLSNYANSPQICYQIQSNGKPLGIPAALMDSFVIAANYPDTSIKPIPLRYSQLSFAYPYINKLVTLTGVQMDSNSAGQYYAQPSTTAISTTRTIDFCTVDSATGNTINGTIELYNSGYADFYSAIEPTGYGNITGVFSLYNSTNQFQIRDTTDVDLSQPRCHK